MPKSLKDLLAQQEKLKEEIRKVQRTHDTRNKLLLGVAILEAEKAGELPKGWSRKLLDKYIKRPTDRSFLELPELPKSDSNSSADSGIDATTNGHQHQEQQQYQQTY